MLRTAAGAEAAIRATRTFPASCSRSQSITPGVVKPPTATRMGPRRITACEGKSSVSAGTVHRFPLTYLNFAPAAALSRKGTPKSKS